MGILHPATLTREKKRNVEILGPNGVLIIGKKDELIVIISALISNGNIIIGNSEFEIEETNKYLINPLTSRTTSYILSISKCCKDVNEFYSTIKHMSFGILGCGGIGSLSSVILSQLPFKEVYLIDPDIIEESNFNRQLFWKRSDIGKFKVDALKSHIYNRNPHLKVNVMKTVLCSANLEEIINKIDCILFTADNPIGINNIAKKIAKKESKYFLAAGYSFNKILFDNKLDINVANELQWEPINKHIMPSSGPINAEASGIACNMILKMIFYKKRNLQVKQNSINTW